MQAVTGGSRRCRGSARGQRGATIVEAAMATGVFFTLLLGLFEFGWAMRDYLATADIARTASRVGSSAGNDAMADYEILQSVRKGTASLNAGQLQYVVIFRASAPGQSVPAACTAGASGTPVAGLCNVYSEADLMRPMGHFGCQSMLPSPDRHWCPAGRNVNLSGPPDLLGVYVKVRHDAITKLLGSGVTFTDQSVLRLEPEER